VREKAETMADSATTKELTRPVASFARRYGLAVVSVAGALLLDRLFHHFNLPHPFAAFALSAIAITFWYGGTKPGIVAVLLSSLIRGFLFEGETSGLSRVLYELVFLTFAILMIWVRRRKEALEVAIVDRTAKLTAANEELHRRKEQLDALFELSPDAVILTDDNFNVLRINKEFTRIFGYTAEEAVGKWLPDLIVPEELRAESLKYRASLTLGKTVELEAIRQRKGGVRFDVSVVAKGISLGFNQVAFHLIYRDITARKNAERKLERSEANLLESQRLMHMCSWAYDPSSGKVAFSPEVKRIYDIESDQDIWAADLFPDMVHPEDRLAVKEIFRRAQLDKTDYDASYRIVLPDGSIKHLFSVGHPVLNQSGELVEFVGTSMDVTEQWKARTALEKAFEEIKQRTEAARRSERELRDVVNTVPAHVWSSSPEGQVDFVNDRWLQFTGLASGEVFGWKWEAVLHPDDRTRVVADWHTALQNGQAMESEARVRRADGEYCWWFIRNVPLRDESGKLVRWYGTAIDIDDRKRAEQALRKSEERWRSVFENSAIGVALTDLNGRFLATNHVYQAIVGYTEEELRALCFLDVTHEDYREPNWALITELLEGKRQQFQIEKKYLRKDGSSIWVSNNVSLVPGTERVPRFIMALSEDITERKRAEQALRRSEAYLAEAQRLTKTGSWAYDPAAEKAMYWSDEMRRIFELDPQRSNLPNREEFVRMIHVEDRERFNEGIERSRREKADFAQDYRLVLTDGTVKHIHRIGHPVLDEAGNIIQYVGTDVDVTERKRAEEKLRRSEADLLEAQRLSQTGSWKLDASSETVTVSPQIFRIFGVNPDEDTSTPAFWFSRNHFEDQERIQELFESCRIQKTDYDADYRIVLPDGTIKHLHAVGHPVLNESGDLVEFVGTVLDITERKQREEALLRSEGYLAEAQKLTHTGSWAVRVPQMENAQPEAGQELSVIPRFGWEASYWSKEIYRIFCFDPSPTPPSFMQVVRRFHPEDARSNTSVVEQAVRDKTDFEIDYRLLLPNGPVKYIHVVGHPVVNASGDVIELVGTAMDVTEQHEARAALQTAFEQIKAEETELRRMTDAVASYIYVLRPDGTALYANQTVLDYTGLTLEDVQRQDYRARVFHPEDLERLREERYEALARGMPFELEQRALGKDGNYRWFLIRYNPLRDDHGNILRWYATGTDIEDRKRTEERVRDENLALREQIDQTFMFEEIVGSSSALQTVLSSVVKVAPTDSTVLITGETGTGKELIARAIHKHSQRSGQAFISVNCASIPSSLIASELFGHEKGAFTGAVQRRQGRFELAHAGTIFLDEVGELPAETQIMLLRVLQERQFERVGGNQILTSDVRVIAATNRDLSAAIAAGTFRPDLFYRLNVFPIEVPPLRKRKDDIPMLVEYFVKRYAEKAGKQIRKIDMNTLDRCQSYSWPGNIRELQNIVERSVILSSGDTFWIEETWLASPAPARHELPGPLPDTLQNQEREIIETALAECNGRVAGPKGAAAKLGIPRSTLDSKIAQLKIKKHKFISK
jgi:PAS domain S-box-containing protein